MRETMIVVLLVIGANVALAGQDSPATVVDALKKTM
jgi:hypothetical protein